MRASYITVKELDFLAIKQCRITKKVNRHGVAKIVGIIKDEDEETYEASCMFVGKFLKI